MAEKHTERSTAGPAQYVALGAGIHALVEGIPEDAYPIPDWDGLWRAAAGAGAAEVRLVVPGARKVSLERILDANAAALQHVLGDAYFPIRDREDLATKAGFALMALVVRQFGAPSAGEEAADEVAAAELEAFRREFAG